MSLPSTTLTIQLSRADRAQIAAQGEMITVVRSFASDGDYVVVCAAFAPFGPSNTVLLGPQWYQYATQQPSASGTVVQMALSQVAAPGTLFAFTGSDFTPQGKAYAPDVFGLANQSLDPLQCGIAQDVCINGAPSAIVPLVLASTPANQTSYFQPQTEVKLLLASNVQAGMLLPAGVLQPVGSTVQDKGTFTVGKYLTVDISSNTTVYFDAVNNCFTLTPPLQQVAASSSPTLLS